MPKSSDVWVELCLALYDEGHRGYKKVPGTSVDETLRYAGSDYDEVDRLYLDHETIGG